MSLNTWERSLWRGCIKRSWLDANLGKSMPGSGQSQCPRVGHADLFEEQSGIWNSYPVADTPVWCGVGVRENGSGGFGKVHRWGIMQGLAHFNEKLGWQWWWHLHLLKSAGCMSLHPLPPPPSNSEEALLGPSCFLRSSQKSQLFCGIKHR